MPRVGGDGGGGPEKAGGSGFGGWLGGAARAMTGASVGGGYVVLGGTRYGLRLSQVRTLSFLSSNPLPSRRHSSGTSVARRQGLRGNLYHEPWALLSIASC